MTGHKPNSHKKRKPTRLQVSAEKRIQKKARDEVTPEVVTAPPVVTQTQDSAVIPDSPTNPIITARNAPVPVSNGSPTADNIAIAEMAAGRTNEDDSNVDARTLRSTKMVLFNGNIGKHKTIKLTATSVFNFLRQGFVTSLQDDLLAGRRTPSSSAASVRKARSSFDTITYNKQTKVLPGKSRRIAEKEQRTVTPSDGSSGLHQVDVPIFDVNKANTVIPDVDWTALSPTFNLDSKKLRRYVVEDVMFANPKSQERLLLLVSINHVSFASTWLEIYKSQYKSQSMLRVPIMFDKEMFFQIEAVVVKNAKRQDYMDGVVSEDDVKYQLTVQGGAGVCLHFPACDKALDIELKFATVFLQSTTFQIWGTAKIGRDFHMRLVKIRNDANREAMYSRYLTELYGDSAQTLYLSANYKLF
jgi:hypothetical protein